MDACEATKTVMSRIQALDPDNSSKIMGCILIQDRGDKEMIRLAFSPDAILLSCINRAKAHLGLPPNPPSPNPHFPQNPPRILIPNNGGGFHLTRPRLLPYAGNGSGLRLYGGGDFGDEYQLGSPVMSPGDSLAFPFGEDANGGVSSPHPSPFHKRSCSVNDAAFLPNHEEGGCGVWGPCVNFDGVGPIDVVSPREDVSGFDEMMRIRALQRQRFVAMGGHLPFGHSRCMDLMCENPRFKHGMGDLSPLGFSDTANAVARQIYLTFPAESTFKEEDVTNYFGMFGPVQDVRIPYQQKRMFGFVTFVYPETVKIILAKGNPHFVCDSRVLVKPYKEKGKYKEKKQYPHLCLSPSGVDVEHLDTPFGPRMLQSPRDVMLRRKAEHEAEMQHAIELEGRRIMNLQLMDPSNESHHYRYMHGLPINHHLTPFSDSLNLENSEGTEFSANNKMDGGNKLDHGNSDESDIHERTMEHSLPSNLFSSPTKSEAESSSGFLGASTGSVQIPSSSVASLKTCYLQMPKFSPAQEAIEM